MRLIAKVVGVTAVAALALTGCGRTSDSGSGGGSGSTGGSSAGFPANATIGVALPQKTSENWVLAEGLFNDGLKQAGFTPDVQFANGGVSEQQNQIQAMITKQAKVIVIGAIDGAQLGTQVKAAKDSGAIVIAYDRLLKNTPDVDYYIAYDNRKVGQLQGQALLDGMKAKKPNGPYNIELFAGSPDDANAQVFFDGAMDVLKPKIDDGTLKVPSGQTDFNQVVTQGWKAENAQKRMDTLLSANYTSATLDGVLSPNDTLARAIITSVKAAGKPDPDRHRSGLRGRVGQVDHGGRAVLHDQQGHPRAGGRHDQDGAGAPEGPGPAGDQRHQAVQQRCQGRPGPPADPGDRHQGERQGGLRQRPDAPRDRQRGG